MPMMSRLLFFFLLFLPACQKYYVSVNRIGVGRSSLASTFVKSPDPRQEDPPKGEKLLISWNLPREYLDKPLRLSVDLIYRDYEEKHVNIQVEGRRGIEEISLLDEEFKKTRGFLTYRVMLYDEKDQLLKEWQHQLWVKLIKID